VCILLVLRDRVAGWPIVVGSNRDEYRDRPWDPPRLDGGILAPRDRRAGGTWIGLHRAGLLVAVTNRPDPDPDPDRPSRGTLAMDLLAAGTVDGAVARLRATVREGRRNAFQALIASATEAVVGVHPDEEGGVEVRSIPSGLHTLTNRWGLDELDHRGVLDDVDLPPGSTLPEALERMKTALATHEDRGPGAPDTICKHGDDRGTLSSTIVAVPGEPSTVPVFLMAPGAPCEAPWSDHGGELGAWRGRPKG
jgi:hypothetical protein